MLFSITVHSSCELKPVESAHVSMHVTRFVPSVAPDQFVQNLWEFSFCEIACMFCFSVRLDVPVIWQTATLWCISQATQNVPNIFRFLVATIFIVYTVDVS